LQKVNPQSRFGKRKSQGNSGKIDVSVTSLAGNILSHMVKTSGFKDTLLPYFRPTHAGFRNDHCVVA
jgi:hypothetical protein